MNFKTPLFISFSLLALSIPFNSNSFSMAKAEGEENKIWLSTDENIVESHSYYAGLYLNTHEELSALSVEVHFDSSVLSVSGTYNSISANIYDSSVHEDSINYTYIFNEVTLDSDQQLFYFYYDVLSGVTPGRYYFDIVVSEAYNSSLENVQISTSRKYFNVSAASSMKSAYAYLNGGSISTSYNGEFTFSYYLSNSEPSSGAFVIRYDNELFEFVSLTKLNFFDNMICDYNSSLAGEIIVSFAEISSDSNTNLFSITLKTIKNETTSSSITLSTNDLYDTDMNPMQFHSDTLSVSITYDSAYEEKPSITTSYNVNTSNHQVVLTINLEEESHLGAGDFVLKFDKDVLTYVGYEKLISPTFFSVNDKQTQLEQGQIKFSILSTSDIVSGGDILRVTFSYFDARNNRDSSIILTGSGLTDSLTNPIELDISGTTILIPGTDLVIIWINNYLYMDDESFNGSGTGRCVSDGLYEAAKRALFDLDNESINDFRTDIDNKYTSALARYLAWSVANGDNEPFVNNYDFLNASNNRLSAGNDEDNTFLLCVVVSLITSSILLSSVVAIRKRRKCGI